MCIYYRFGKAAEGEEEEEREGWKRTKNVSHIVYALAIHTRSIMCISRTMNVGIY